MTWQTLILISVLLSSVATILQRIILAKDSSNPKAYSIIFQLITGVMIGSFGYLTTDMSYSGIKNLWPNLAIMTVLYGYGNLFIFKALKALPASEFSILFASRVLFTILASSLLLAERLSPQQFLGAILIFLGVILVNIKKQSQFKWNLNQTLGLLAAACFGLANTNDRFILTTVDLYPFLLIAFILPALMITALDLKIIKTFSMFFQPKIFSKIAIMSIIYGLGAITFFTSLKIAPTSSQVVSINLTSIIVTVLLAIILLKETDNLPVKLLATALSFAGLIMLK